MKKNAMSVLVIAGLLSVILSGCQNSARQGDLVHPYQFVKEYGIIMSDNPIYMLDPGTEQKLTQGDVTVHSVFAVQQDRELIVSVVLDDRSDLSGNGEKESAEGLRYQEALWKSGDAMVLTGPGLLQEGCRPHGEQNQNASYVAYYDFYETYGYMRYFLEARFETPFALDFETYPDEYLIRVLDLESPVRLSMVRAPGYGTLEELAKGEQGDVDTHGDFSVISVGENVENGIAVSLYVCSSTGGQTANVVYIPPLGRDKIELPMLSNGEEEYPIWIQDQANPLIDRMGVYQLGDVNRDGSRRRCLFEVPDDKRDGPFFLTIPGLTLLSGEVSEPITLPIPDDDKELAEEIPFQNGRVRLLKISRMKEPQKQESGGNANDMIEKPAVYVDVDAVSDMGETALRGLLCQRKRGERDAWENQRYDFDENGSLSGFRVFLYDEGDTEVTLKFISPAIYWKQPFELEFSPVE